MRRTINCVPCGGATLNNGLMSMPDVVLPFILTAHVTSEIAAFSMSAFSMSAFSMSAFSMSAYGSVALWKSAFSMSAFSMSANDGVKVGRSGFSISAFVVYARKCLVLDVRIVQLDRLQVEVLEVGVREVRILDVRRYRIAIQLHDCRLSARDGRAACRIRLADLHRNRRWLKRRRRDEDGLRPFPIVQESSRRHPRLAPASSCCMAAAAAAQRWRDRSCPTVAHRPVGSRYAPCRSSFAASYCAPRPHRSAECSPSVWTPTAR